MNKNVYIVDNEKMFYFEDLRDELLKEIKSDILENRNDKDIVESGLDLMQKLHSRSCGYNEDFIIRELSNYGVYVVKVNDILDGLNNLKEYFKFNSIGNENELVDKVEDLKNELENFFND